MYYTIYRITNNINGKFYIGKHKTTDLDDGYMGSGKLLKRAIEKYGLENFTKEILHVFDTEEAMNAKEKELVVLNEMSYNLCPGGKGGFGFVNENNLNNKNHENVGQKISKALKGRKNSVLSELNKKRHALGLVKYPTFTGKTHTEKSRQKIGLANKGKIPWNKGKPRTEKEKQKISETLKSKIKT